MVVSMELCQCFLLLSFIPLELVIKKTRCLPFLFTDFEDTYTHERQLATPNVPDNSNDKSKLIFLELLDFTTSKRNCILKGSGSAPLFHTTLWLFNYTNYKGSVVFLKPNCSS